MSSRSFDFLTDAKFSARETQRSLLLHLLVVLVSILFLFPAYYMAVTSTQTRAQIFSFPPKMTFGGALIENYHSMFFETEYLRTLLNSFIYAGTSTLGIVVLSALAGYAFAKYAFPGKEPLFYLILIMLAIPFQLIAIPLFTILVDFGMIDTYAGLILPTIINPIGVFFVRQSTSQTIVDEILESARIDGASEFQIFRYIVLPLLKPTLAALAVILFILRFNGLYWPLVAMKSPSHQVVQAFIATQVAPGPSNPTQWTLLLPAAALATLPVIIIFLVLQKQFIKGMLAGAVKR